MTKIFHINYFPNPSSCFSDLELGLLAGLGWPRARLRLTMDLSHIGMENIRNIPVFCHH